MTIGWLPSPAVEWISAGYAVKYVGIRRCEVPLSVAALQIRLHLTLSHSRCLTTLSHNARSTGAPQTRRSVLFPLVTGF